jgi:phosphatidylglycerol lysyltransferase
VDKLKTEYIDLEDMWMAFSQQGEGKHLILLHGNSGSKAFFKSYQWNYFNDFHTFALESRGHGQSWSEDEVLTYDQQSTDVIRFCEKKGIKNAAVIGYSDGGILGLWLAVKAPEIFERVVAISPNTIAKGSTELTLQFIETSIRVMQALSRLGWNLKRPIMRFQLMLSDSGITEKDLKNISSEVMILYAEKDMVLEEHIQHIAGMIPGCRLEKVMGCNHLNISRKSQAIFLIKDFLLRE